MRSRMRSVQLSSVAVTSRKIEQNYLSVATRNSKIKSAAGDRHVYYE